MRLWTLPLLSLLIACTTDTRERADATPPATPAPRSVPTQATATPAAPLTHTDPKTSPEELGGVRWVRDFEAARAASRAQNKPMFVLFTEVPGCSTVRGFARDALRHPLVIEAIESEFIPVAVYNNIDGPDRKVLNSFKEPTWNNPVVRIIDADRTPLTGRYAGPYHLGGLLPHMTQALERAKRPVPGYLRALRQEHAARQQGVERAVFSMYCFWSGETKLGALPGVISSRTGFAQGAEVVEVTFDPKHTSRDQLAASFGSSPLAAGTQVRSSKKDDKYQLKHSSWRFVPMTPTQASRINAALGTRQDPSLLASPRQRALHSVIRRHPKAKWKSTIHAGDLARHWSESESTANRLE